MVCREIKEGGGGERQRGRTDGEGEGGREEGQALTYPALRLTLENADE